MTWIVLSILCGLHNIVREVGKQTPDQTSALRFHLKHVTWTEFVDFDHERTDLFVWCLSSTIQSFIRHFLQTKLVKWDFIFCRKSPGVRVQRCIWKGERYQQYLNTYFGVRTVMKRNKRWRRTMMFYLLLVSLPETCPINKDGSDHMTFCFRTDCSPIVVEAVTRLRHVTQKHALER